ncbi:hypothetical protein FZC84_11905 [Rossellomorea vietnamensis]|uniref:DUF3168 domain-containing protein n=1 Tax=Rossellomorea vietnamensis TaxID=218284 RepID=A0A5D4MAY1_9BACI|nr:hypothetical protein [Rossellomorea vietnamensis]TYR99074.1 hypothetical protein FZC84_11905 [Rossellomorea vietnamensis]
MKSPKIQLFNAVFSKSLALGYNTYDYLPGKDDETPYPFVHVAGSISSDVLDNKDMITGIISQTVNVWGLANNKASFAEMVFSLEQELRKLTKLDNYFVRMVSLDSNEIPDNTTTDNLLHGIIQAEYKLS